MAEVDYNFDFSDCKQILAEYIAILNVKNTKCTITGSNDYCNSPSNLV